MTDHGNGLVRRIGQLAGIAAVLAAAVLLAGCSGMSGALLSGAQEPPPQVAGNTTAPEQPKNELEKATEYWGKQHASNPRDGTIALNYAKNLKAMGRKHEALIVLQQTHLYNANNREHLSEYGRLALELGQVSTAQQLLARADDPANPDWRVISARGTALAKQGQYKEAIPFFERAGALAPNQASVLNNLAMAYAMDGQAEKAEGLLRQAESADANDPRVRQNLALVLGLQGKYAEAKGVAAKDLSEDTAQANIDYLRKLVRIEGKSQPATQQAAPSTWATVSTSSIDNNTSRSASAAAQPR